MGSKHGCKQHSCQYRDVEERHGGKSADNHGHHEGIQSEYGSIAEVLLQVEHVDLNAGKEHEIQQSHLTEHLETHVAGQYVEAIRPYKNTCHNQAYHVRYLKLVKQYRCDKDYGKYYQEYSHR